MRASAAAARYSDSISTLPTRRGIGLSTTCCAASATSRTWKRVRSRLSRTWLPYAAATVTATIPAAVHHVPRSGKTKPRPIIRMRQTVPSRTVGSTGHMAAARAGAAGRRRLKAISGGVA